MKQNFAQTTCSSDFFNKKLKIILFYYLQMWIDILAAYCYSLAGEDFNWVQVTNKLLCSAATGWNFTVTVVCCRTALLLLCFVIFEIQTSGILTQLSLLMLLGYNFM